MRLSNAGDEVKGKRYGGGRATARASAVAPRATRGGTWTWVAVGRTSQRTYTANLNRGVALGSPPQKPALVRVSVTVGPRCGGYRPRF